MTTIDTHVGVSTHTTGSSFVASVGQWVTSSDHKKIGRLFIGLSLLYAIAVAAIGALIGFERINPDGAQFFDADAALQLTQLHRHALVFGLLAPLFIGIAIAVVPMQVGARAIAFPRLAQFSFWTWAFGTDLVLISFIANGGPGGGSSDMVDLYLLGLALTLAGLLAGAVSVATTVLTSRAPGMGLADVPAFSWSALMGSVASVLSLPVAIGTIAYLYVDHTYSQTAFGDNKVINTWLGWVYAQPQTFVLIVMALGVLAEIAPVTARVRQPLRPVLLAGIALITTATLGAVTQTAHVLDLSGTNADKLSSTILFLFFNGLPLLGALVTVAVAMLSFKQGRPGVSASFAFALLGALMLLAGIAGSFVQHIGDAALVGTSFGEGVTAYVVYGGLLAGLGAITFWAPKLWGVVLDDKKVLGLAGLGFIGVVLASLPLYVAGFADQPVDAVNDFDYSGPLGLWNVLAGAGSAVIALVVLAYVGLLVTTVRQGAGATDDPWDAHTLEWSIPSPAPTDNFSALATVSSSEPLLDVKPSQEVPA
jgi:heme/copper-type cytochrome/quinol oxidase subunit 1